MAANRQLRRARLAALLGAQAAAAARDADGLAITGLRALRLREPDSRRSYTVVRVETRSGLTGFGECGAVADAELDLERVRAIVLGKPATAYGSCAAPWPAWARSKPRSRWRCSTSWAGTRELRSTRSWEDPRGTRSVP